MGRVRKLLERAPLHDSFLEIELTINNSEGTFSFNMRKIEFDIRTLN